LPIYQIKEDTAKPKNLKRKEFAKYGGYFFPTTQTIYFSPIKKGQNDDALPFKII